MPGLTDTIARLAALRGLAPAREASRLVALDGFGDDPGALGAWYHLPEPRVASPALVVVLHGCTQTAAGYDAGSGWSTLADRHGFALLYPEQHRRNNPNGCFNWFAPGDARRGAGEALSIRQMVAAMVERHGIDPARVFVTGLSAGGAMAATMLATYPDVFAGGAVIAGLPHGTAAGVGQAIERMAGRGLPEAATLARLVRDASPHAGPWPVLSVWHGDADKTVSPVNADAIVAQWRGVHGLPAEPTRTERVDGQSRRMWCDAAGRPVIEDHRIAGLGHGTPLATSGPDGCGAAGPYMIEAGISSTRHIARFWGLVDAAAEHRPVADAYTPAPVPEPMSATVRASRDERPAARAPRGRPAVGTIIEDALRAAGLMR